MAAIRKRPGPDGRAVYQAIVRRRGYPQKYRTFNTRRDAQAWARRIESEIDAGTYRDTREGDSTTLREALTRYGREVTERKRASTARSERNRVKRLAESRLAQYGMSRIGGKELAQHIHEREKTLGAHSIRLELSLISHLYNVARGSWGMPYLVNPVPLVKHTKPRPPEGRDRRLRDGEEARLLDAATPQIAAVIRWALATAMRRSEIARLQWQDIDMQRRSAYLAATDTKTRAARTVPLSRDALAVLRAIPRQLSGSVFGMSADTITAGFALARKKTGINGLRFHDLRHEATSRLFERTNLDALEIKAITGHQSMQMLARYTHLRTANLADRLDGAERGEA